MTETRVEPIPNFFIVGAPKCATTAMDRYLSEHPDIFMCPYKESNYFARDLYPHGGGCTEDQYRAFFQGVGNEAIVGESSVFYMLSEDAARAIHEFQPKAKILIMLRDPVELVESHHSQIVYETYETEKDLKRALDLEPERRKAANGKAVEIPERVRYYSDFVAFTAQIQRYLDHFPKDQVHVVLYDDVKRDLPGVYRGVLEFLGVDPDFEASFVVENANKKMRSESFGRFLRETPDWVSAAARILLPKNEWRMKMRGMLKRLNTNFKKRDPIPEDLQLKLARQFKPEAEKLGQMLGRDLSHWCRTE